MATMVYFFYRTILAPFMIGLVQFFHPLLKGKLRTITDQRNSGTWVFEKNPGASLKNAYWIHAASGEIEYARPLIRELKKNYPETPVVVTYSSPSAQKILQKVKEVDAWGPSPWELPASCQKFISDLSPRAVFFARTDVWPILVDEIKKQNIPAILFSATFAENSSRLKGLTRWLTEFSLRRLDHVLVASPEDLQVLSDRGLHVKALVGGDTRYDQVFHRLENPLEVRQELKPTDNLPVMIAGSTWPEDEKVLLEWFCKFRPSIRLLLAPHEISETRMQALQKYFDEMNMGCDFYSKSKKWSQPVLILDQVGVLAELYTWGQIAFVGGSFKKQVHSVMEPLAAGLPVIVGPYHLNNREALHFKKATQQSSALVHVAQSPEDFQKIWKFYQKKLGPDLKNEIRQVISQHRGSTEEVLKILASV